MAENKIPLIQRLQNMYHVAKDHDERKRLHEEMQNVSKSYKHQLELADKIANIRERCEPSQINEFIQQECESCKRDMETAKKSIRVIDEFCVTHNIEKIFPDTDT